MFHASFNEALKQLAVYDRVKIMTRRIIQALFWIFPMIYTFGIAQSYPLPKVVSRADWGAREPRDDIKRYEAYGVAKPAYTKVILHNTAMGNGVGSKEAQAIQDKQMDDPDFMFSDIGYNFLIDSNGTIFEGRALFYVPSHAGQCKEANQTHDITMDPDFGAIGLAFSASSQGPLSAAQIESAYQIIRFWIFRNGYGVNEVITHAEVKDQLISKGLTPIGAYDPHVCTGDGTLESIVTLRRRLLQDFKIPFDEQKFRNLF